MEECVELQEMSFKMSPPKEISSPFKMDTIAPFKTARFSLRPTRGVWDSSGSEVGGLLPRR